MATKRFLKVAVFLLVFAGVAQGAFAQVTISGGFALSSMKAEFSSGGDSQSYSGDVGVGGNIYVDYLLPIGVPLSLGLEIGVDTATVEAEDTEIKGTVIPLLLRAAYHFDLMPKLDLYAVGKIGVAFGSAEYGSKTEDGYFGVGFGIDVGAAYYFTPRFGVFAEVGFDRYNLQQEFSESYYEDGYYESYNYKIEVPFSRFFTIGISTKF